MKHFCSNIFTTKCIIFHSLVICLTSHLQTVISSASECTTFSSRIQIFGSTDSQIRNTGRAFGMAAFWQNALVISVLIASSAIQIIHSQNESEFGSVSSSKPRYSGAAGPFAAGVDDDFVSDEDNSNLPFLLSSNETFDDNSSDTESQEEWPTPKTDYNFELTTTTTDSPTLPHPQVPQQGHKFVTGTITMDALILIITLLTLLLIIFILLVIVAVSICIVLVLCKRKNIRDCHQEQASASTSTSTHKNLDLTRSDNTRNASFCNRVHHPHLHCEHDCAAWIHAPQVHEGDRNFERKYHPGIRECYV